MQFSLPKKWRTLCWAALALMMADMMILSVGVLLGGGALLFLVCVLLLVAAAALAIVSSLNLRCPACGRPASDWEESRVNAAFDPDRFEKLRGGGQLD